MPIRLTLLETLDSLDTVHRELCMRDPTLNRHIEDRHTRRKLSADHDMSYRPFYLSIQLFEPVDFGSVKLPMPALVGKVSPNHMNYHQHREIVSLDLAFGIPHRFTGVCEPDKHD